MTEVRIRYLGLIQRTVGKREEVVHLPKGSTLGDLLNHLAAEYGSGFEEKVLQSGELGPHATVLVDGINVSRPGGLETILEGQGSVEIVVLGPPPMGC